MFDFITFLLFNAKYLHFWLFIPSFCLCRCCCFCCISIFVLYYNGESLSLICFKNYLVFFFHRVLWNHFTQFYFFIFCRLAHKIIQNEFHLFLICTTKVYFILNWISFKMKIVLLCLQMSLKIIFSSFFFFYVQKNFCSSSLLFFFDMKCGSDCIVYIFC